MYEMAYQIAGTSWKRKCFRTAKQMERFIERLIDDNGSCVEIRYHEDNPWY